MPAGPIGSVWKAGSWSNTAWEANTWATAGVITFPLILGDFTTLLAKHFDVLYAATPDDLNTLLSAEIPTVRTDVDAGQKDLNTDWDKFLG